jgi:hypothetical protein
VFKRLLPVAWLKKCPHKQGKFNFDLAVSLEGPVRTKCDNDDDEDYSDFLNNVNI